MKKYIFSGANGAVLGVTLPAAIVLALLLIRGMIINNIMPVLILCFLVAAAGTVKALLLFCILDDEGVRMVSAFSGVKVLNKSDIRSAGVIQYRNGDCITYFTAVDEEKAEKIVSRMKKTEKNTDLYYRLFSAEKNRYQDHTICIPGSPRHFQKIRQFFPDAKYCQ